MGFHEALPGSLRDQRMRLQACGMSQIWPTQKIEKISSHLPWSWGRWEIRNIRVSRMGTEEVKYENGFLDPFLGKKNVERISKSGFFFLTNVIFFLFEEYHLDNLSSSFCLLLTIRLTWNAYKTKKQKASWSGRSKKDLVFVLYHHLLGPENSVDRA